MATPLIVLFTGIFGALGIWLAMHHRRVQQDRAFEHRVHARKRGWSYDAKRDGRVDYRFGGAAHGIEWSMWYDSDRGDDSPTPKAYWHSTNVRAPRLSLVVIGRQRYQRESGTVGRILMDVVSGVAHAGRSGTHENAYRAEKSEFYESAVTLDEGRAAFRERYVAAVAPDMPRGWLDEELQKLLLEWPAQNRGVRYQGDQKVEATLDQSGLRICAQQMPEDFVYWAHLARLGEVLSARLTRVASA